jgi:diaminopimelate epimerase
MLSKTVFLRTKKLPLVFNNSEMKIHFEKYQGTGNDFVMLDNLNGQYDDLTVSEIQLICDRRFGVGADGLIKINKHSSFDFEVDYYNSDGSKSFCGNGARCAVAFAESIGVIKSKARFLAIDGVHQATKHNETIALDMMPVGVVNQENESFILDTGSPHFVRFVKSLKEVNILDYGREIRYSEKFKSEGINVNIIEQISENSIKIRTYERGVEDETLSCGTGATACALVVGLKDAILGKRLINVDVLGGKLSVSYENLGNGNFSNIQLIGPGKFVFKGEIDV